MLFSFTVSYATPPASPYTAGETLDPQCAPGSSSCSVMVAPWIVNGTSVYYPTGNVGIGTTTPVAALTVAGDGAILATGTSGSGISVPNLGAGTRMMWIPSKAAFRAGTVDGTQWNNANVGSYSVAFGNNTTASGSYSVAFGNSTTASGDRSAAFGNSNSTSGDFSTVFGAGNIATSYGSTTIGVNSIGGGSPTTWVPTDPLFEVGNAQTPSPRSDAFIILKNGNVGIGAGVAPAVIFQVGATNGFGVVQNSAGSGADVPAGGLIGSNSGNFIIQSDITTGAAGTSLVLSYHSVSLGKNLSALTVTNVASGFSNLLLMQGGGNVGIGTASPQQLLDVNGIIKTSSLGFSAGGSNGTHRYLTSEVNGGGGYNLNFYNSVSGNNAGSFGFYGIGNSVPSLFVYAATATVGIGTNAPSAQLTLQAAASNAPRIRINDVNGAELMHIGADNASDIFIGKDAGINTVSPAVQNIFIGGQAGQNNTTGAFNTAIGNGVLMLNQTASNNVALGAGTMGALTTGSLNTGLGQGALGALTTGSGNTAVGGVAMQMHSSGSYNTVIGDTAFFNAGGTSGSYNIVIGAWVNPVSLTGSGQLNIGNVIFGTGMYQTASNSSTPVLNGAIAVGTTATSSLFTLGGSRSASAWGVNGINFQTVAATYNDSTSSGTVANNMVNSFGIPTLTSTAAVTYTNAATVYIAGNPIPGTNVTITNPYALIVNGNTSIAGAVTGTTFNAISGTIQNAVFSGSGNGYIGTRSNNPLVLRTNDGDAMTILTNKNIGIGTSTPSSKLDVSSTDSTTTLTLNSAAMLSVSNIGTTTNNFSDLAFGTNDLGGTSVAGARISGVFTSHTTSAVSADIAFSTRNAGTMAEKMRIQADGKVGISNTTPGYLLHVGDSASSGIVARFENSTGTCDINPTTTALVCSSDMNLKKNITLLADNSTWNFNSNISIDNHTVLSRILALTPVSYNWNSESNTDSKHPGFIAQDVRQLFPDLVAEDKNTHLLSMNYTGLIPYTVQAIKEMNLNIVAINDLGRQNTWRDALTAWLGNASNHITRIFTGEICLSEAGQESECLNRSQLKALKASLNNQGGGSTTVVNTPPPAPDPVEIVEPETQTPDVVPEEITTPASPEEPSVETEAAE